MGKGEKCGGAATQTGAGCEPPTCNGRPVHAALEDVERCFDSLAGVIAAESATLAKLLKSTTLLAASNTTLTTSNATLMTSNAELTKTRVESKGGGGGNGGGGCGRGKRGDATYLSKCKRDTWHKGDDCFELKKNQDKRPSFWKTA